MLTYDYKDDFLKKICKIKDHTLKERIIKHIEKIIENPDIGKPMRFARKGTREVHISPFRLAYAYFPAENKIKFIDIYHKDEQ